MMRPVHMHHRASAIGDFALGGALAVIFPVAVVTEGVPALP